MNISDCETLMLNKVTSSEKDSTCETTNHVNHRIFVFKKSWDSDRNLSNLPFCVICCFAVFILCQSDDIDSELL